jgi:hypothetical protein
VDEARAILESLSEVKERLAGMREGHGQRLLAIETAIAKNNGNLSAITEAVGRLDTRAALLEASHAVLIGKWGQAATNSKDEKAIVANLQSTVNRLTLVVPVASFLGAGVVKLVDILGWL